MSEPAWKSSPEAPVFTPVRLWVAGARPKTLGAAIAPVVVGTAAATIDGPIRWARAVAALVVALALQIGVNYANDYSDGVRGTDKDRRGPIRLVASGLASPAAVRTASAISFAVAAIVGGVLSLVVNPWLLLIGIAALIAAVTYTGGPKPYGYLGLGEIMVLVFFGFVATVGSAYVQYRQLPGAAWFGALAVGLPACGVLLANNVRDVETDTVAGKRTLAVRFGAPRARMLFAGCLFGALLAVAGCGVLHPWALLALAAAPLAITPIRLVRTRSDPPSLVAALVGTVRYQLALAALLAAGLWIS
ncbi:MAG: 1,4-dihydroxy-2-naphthoate polyprenyltransferase [Actinomycetota bacterium]|nr:1,4-dihydroxy-2-naphthoate polyprenyltransferase [Actinomycetota bacterium]